MRPAYLMEGELSFRGGLAAALFSGGADEAIWFFVADGIHLATGCIQLDIANGRLLRSPSLRSGSLAMMCILAGLFHDRDMHQQRIAEGRPDPELVEVRIL